MSYLSKQQQQQQERGLLVEDAENDGISIAFNNQNFSFSSLPITVHKKQILYALQHHEIVCVVGETGSGKSTQIPKFLLEGGWCSDGQKVVCTQPRRLAAITLAQRVSQEVGKNDKTVGYIVRFDNSTYDPIETKIKYVTDGILVREALVCDPLLLDYSVVMVDEAHERGIMSDVLLGILKKIRQKRPSLRIIICSATINAQSFVDYFCRSKKSKKNGSMQTKGCVISVDGRQYPIDSFFLDKPCRNYIKSCVDTVIKLYKKEKSGDVLVFLPTAEDCDEAIRMTEEQLQLFEKSSNSDNSKRRRQHFTSNVLCLPLYGSLPQHLQGLVFRKDLAEKNKRRFIFATNIAETSVTVPDIEYVVDSGYVKLPFFDSKHGLERLVVSPISKASAKQRGGRAGRCSPGKCYRLYTEKFYAEKMQVATAPEILRTNLTSFVLTLKALGIDDFLSFDLLTPPSKDSLCHALENLFALNAIDDNTTMTELGSQMCEFPIGDPRLSKVLLTSIDMKCSEEILIIASVMQVRDIFRRPRSVHQRTEFDAVLGEVVERSGDHSTYVNLFMDRSDLLGNSSFVNVLAIRRAKEIRSQLKRFLRNYGSLVEYDGAESRDTIIRKCMSSGYFLNVAKLSNDGNYYTIKGNQKIVPSTASSVFSRFGQHSSHIIFGETFDGAQGNLEVRHISSINSVWLRELCPHYWV